MTAKVKMSYSQTRSHKKCKCGATLSEWFVSYNEEMKTNTMRCYLCGTSSNHKNHSI